MALPLSERLPRTVLVASAALLVSLTACRSWPTTVSVPLVYRSPGAPEKGKSLSITPGTRLYIDVVVDERKDKSTIGMNEEQEKRIPAYGVDGTPPGYLDQALHTELGKMGFLLADRPEGATWVLSTKLVRFFVVEGNTYVAEVDGEVALKDQAGKTVFSAGISGSAKQWGKSANAANYQEVLARASADFVGTLADKPDFRKATGAP